MSGEPASPLGIDFSSPRAFYFLAARVLACAFVLIAVLAQVDVRNGSRRVRDQPRRMKALGWHDCLVRLLASSRPVGVGRRRLYAYTTSRARSTRLTSSAEVLLMVIAGGAGTC